jgi:hypothetical protein
MCAADIATVVEGQTYQPSMRRLPYGGADLTAYLAKLLEARGVHVTDVDSLAPVKEKCIKVVEKESLLEEALEQVCTWHVFVFWDGPLCCFLYVHPLTFCLLRQKIAPASPCAFAFPDIYSPSRPFPLPAFSFPSCCVPFHSFVLVLCPFSIFFL